MALANLLNAIGKELKPRVKCVIHPQNKGAGIPDGGFFTADQFQRSGEPLAGQLPVRGALEVKPVNHNVKKLAEKEFDPPQTSKLLCSLHIIERGANLFPLRVQAQRSSGLFADAEPTSPAASRTGWEPVLPFSLFQGVALRPERLLLFDVLLF